MNENDMIPYIEPIFRFCCRRVSERHDAEDLAGEIICHVLDGMKKYEITSLSAWVWRIAHNRYARWAEEKNRRREMMSDADLYDAEEDYCLIDEEGIEREYDSVFRSLHTLSGEYRNIFVDYYIGELPIRSLAEKYSVAETTVKWRLNVGREKIRQRIGDDTMDKIYTRINWNTTCCNGSMDSNRYLATQLARAICKAAYEKPLSVEEISLATGIPAMYIEDELPRLEYGDAVRKIGSKYATDFIVFDLENRKKLEGAFAPKVKAIADKLSERLAVIAEDIRKIGFYGCEFGMERLGHIAVPQILRQRIGYIKDHVLDMPSGEFPPRHDGDYGWFIVAETEDEREWGNPNNAGRNSVPADDGAYHYYWIARYFAYPMYSRGMKKLAQMGCFADGRIPAGRISDMDAASLIGENLIVRAEEGYRLNFPCFTAEQYQRFKQLTVMEDTELDGVMAELIRFIHKGFVAFVPARLASQINQWVSGYANSIVGYVTEELITRGVLRAPEEEAPFVDGVYCVME